MLKAYIDPGTGSMLFGILIGIIGAAGFLIRNAIVKLRFVLSGGKGKHEVFEKIPLVIFADDKRYWKNFEPICRELDRRGIDVTYMTLSEDDPALECPYPHIHGEIIGKGNKGYFKLNFLNANIVLSTTPGLDVYQWKRSKNVDFYVHIAHAPNDVILYRMFALDYYDAVLLSGEYQIDQLRELEKLRDLPKKELVLVGLPYMDETVKRLKSDKAQKSDKKTVLLAPTWGPEGIFSKYGGTVIDQLLKTDYNIIVRPHPQSLTSEKEILDKIMKKYPDSDRLQWNFDNDNHQVLSKSDILVSDFSGVLFEFGLIYNKPVIYTEAKVDYGILDQWWLNYDLWTFKALPMMGAELTPENFDNLSQIIEDCINNPEYEKNRQKLREETWVNYGKGANAVADYLENKLKQLTKKEEEK